MAALRKYTSLAEVEKDFEEQWKNLASTAARDACHPIDILQDALRAPQQKMGFAKAVIPLFKQANPEFNKHITTIVNETRAVDVKMGHPGVTHALTLGIDTVPKTSMGVFWRGKPAPEKIWSWVIKSLRESFNTTQKGIKLCISPQLCGVELADKVFFTGYGGGSSVGFAQTLGLYMLVNAKGDASNVPEVQAWLKSLTEIKVTWVVYQDSFDRLFDAISSKSRAKEIEDTHPLMFAMGIRQAATDMPIGFQITKAFLQKKVDEHNSKTVGSSRIGRRKKEATEVMILHMPESVFKGFEQEYHSLTWEKMALNSTTAGSNVWKMGHIDPVAKGSWIDVYINGEEAIKLVQVTMHQQYRKKYQTSKKPRFLTVRKQGLRMKTLIPCPCGHECS